MFAVRGGTLLFAILACGTSYACTSWLTTPRRQFHAGSWMPCKFQYWASHMGNLLPSLRFRSGNSSSEKEVVPCSECFSSPVISKAQALTLLDLWDIDFIMDISFAHLECLAIHQPGKYIGGINRPLDLALIPTLQRLYIDFQISAIDLFPRLSWETHSSGCEFRTPFRGILCISKSGIALNGLECCELSWFSCHKASHLLECLASSQFNLDLDLKVIQISIFINNITCAI